MGSVKIRELIPPFLTLLFLGLCIYFANKAQEGPWHATGLQLWEKGEWHKLRAMGENLYQVEKGDVESFYLAMLASEQMQDAGAAKLFAARLSDSRVLSWKLEKQISRLYRPESLRKRIALFRARIVFGAAIAISILLIFSLRRNEPFKLVPAFISCVGMFALWL